MDALTLKINLDCLRKDSQAIINAKVGEANGRKVVFTLYEGRTAFFVPAEATVIFRAQKPDGTILYNNCVIDDGKVEYTITSQTVAVAGVYACELQIVSDGRIIYSPYVTLNVMDNLYADTEVESSNEFTELENALNKIPPLEVIYSKYTKPDGGIPKADLANDVQASLNKADTALQEHQSLAAYRTASEQDIIDSTKQNKLTAGENITITENGTISSTGGGANAFFLNVFVITETQVVTNKTYAEIKAAIDAGDIIYITDKNGIVYMPQVGTSNVAIEMLWIESQYNRTLYWTAVVDSENAWSAAEFELVDIDKLVFELSDKVDKETGKGLSTNDYTAADKAKVDAIPASPKYTDTVYDDTAVKNRLTAVENEIAGIEAGSSFSGSYNDLTDKPTIPDAVTEGTVSGWGFTKNTGTYSKPTGGIPKADLAPAVQTSLGKADSALQSHQSLAAYRTASAQDTIDKGKVDKVTGKGLSTNDYTNAAKAKVDAIPASPKYTDTVYDDTAVKNRLTAIENKENVTLTPNTARISNVSCTAKYFPLLGMVFVRIYGKICADLNVGYDYDLFTVGSRVPDSNAALSVKCGKNAMALAKTSSSGSAIQIRPLESGINGYDVFITGFWFA